MIEETPEERTARLAAAEQAEIARVATLSDAQVLKVTSNAAFGPGIVGKPLADRAAKIMRDTGGGIFGPAITDPDYAAKQAAKRTGVLPTGNPIPDDLGPPPVVGEGDPIDPTDLHDPRNPWMYVTLGGAKQLAMAHSVSYVPKVQRKALIEQLQAANVVPPAIPSDSDEDDGA